jgi:outer membrane protein assembly factor BamD
MIRLFFFVYFLLSIQSQFSNCLSFDNHLEKLSVQAKKYVNFCQYKKAILLYKHIKIHFPYSALSVVCNLCIADCLFKQKKFIQAIDMYIIFISFNPNNKLLPYSYLQLVKSCIKLITTNYFLSYINNMRDQSSIYNSLIIVNLYLKRFPKHECVHEAVAIKDRLIFEFINRELIIAKFYFSRDKWISAFLRYKFVIDKYSSSLYTNIVLENASKFFEKLY